MTEPIKRFQVGFESPLGTTLEVGQEIKPGLTADMQVGGLEGHAIGAGAGLTYRLGDPLRDFLKPTVSVRARVLGMETDKGLDGGLAVGARFGLTMEESIFTATAHVGVGRLIGIEGKKFYPEAGVLMGFRF